MLGDLLHDRRNEAKPILYDLARKGMQLSELLQDDYPEASEILSNERAQSNPVWRLAEALTFLQGRKNTQNNVVSLLDSASLMRRPNGLSSRRAVVRRQAGAAKKTDLRSLVFTDAVLDYLVHLHVLRNGNKDGYRPLSFRELVQILRRRYGFCVDEAPPGMTISNDLLRLNRIVLERRLRDLGLLIGVNDAEAMKRLRPRFKETEAGNVVD